MPPPSSGANDDASPVDLYKLAVCTTVYSLIEGLITYPYDLVKTRQQAGRPGTAATSMPTLAYVHKLIRSSGPRSLYRGFSWNVLGGVPSEVAYYATYTQAKEAMFRTHTGRQHPSAVFFFAGLLSDVVGVLLWVPADIISQRLQLAEACETASHKRGMCLEIGAVRPTDVAVSGSLHTREVSAGERAALAARQVTTCRGEIGGEIGGDWNSGQARGPAEVRRRLLKEFSVFCPPPSHSTTSTSSTSAATHSLRGGGGGSCGGSVATAAAAAAAAAGSSSNSGGLAMRHEMHASAPLSGLQVVRDILRREGILGLWRGTWITMATLA